MNKRRALPLLLSALSLAGGCGDGGGPQAGPPLGYRSDAQVVMDRYCTSCHQAGGIGPFALTDYASVRSHADLIRGAVDSGLMPPWLPSDAGQPLRYSRQMRPEDRALLLRWIDAGAPEGDPAAAPRTDIPPAETVVPPRPDLVLDPGVAYTPNRNLSDDYRCFVLDPGLAEDGYFAAGDIRPGDPSIVHHVIVFEVPAAEADQVRQRDAAEAGLGYTCFGGPGNGGQSQTLLVWAPGSVPTRAPQGLGLKVQKGSVLVMQVHYNLVNYRGGEDRTVARLERSAGVPEQILWLLPAAEPAKLKLAAGDSQARQIITIPMWAVLSWLKVPSLMMWGNVPHMHLLGKRIETRLTDGTKLLEVPRWDFHWQQVYQFREPFELRAGDTLQVECDYDNSAANQPVLNGQRQNPKDTTWGEKTTDEMCLSYIQVALDPSMTL